MTTPALGTRRECFYLRVSGATKSRRGEVLAFEQDPAVQERPLRHLIAQRGWILCRVYFRQAYWPGRPLEQPPSTPLRRFMKAVLSVNIAVSFLAARLRRCS